MLNPPSPITQVVDLFTSDLRDVRFGDVDAPALLRLADEVASLAAHVVAAQAALEAARDAHRERSEALALIAQRALAYARVYAEGDEALARRLDAIPLARSAKRRPDAEATWSSVADGTAPKRPRGRPRKDRSAEGSAPLPLGALDAE